MKQAKECLIALMFISCLLFGAFADSRFLPAVFQSTSAAEDSEETEKMEVTVYQIWNDAGNLDGIRPVYVPVLVDIGESSFLITSSEPVRIPEGNAVFTQFQLPDGYTVKGPYINKTVSGLSVVFLNSHVPATIRAIQNTLEEGNLIIEKIAEDAKNDEIFWFDVSFISDPERDYIFTTTRGARGFVSDGIPLHAGEVATIQAIPVGTEYKAVERENWRFLSSGTNSTGKVVRGDNVVTFTNELITTNFVVYKQWEGTKKDTISLHLFADGEATDFMPEKSGGTYTFFDLPKYDMDGHEILYTAKEDYMNGYMTMYVNKGKYADRSKAVYNGGTIINREVTTFFIHKEWIGAANPPEIRFQLYQNGKLIEWRQPKNVGGGIYIWENLPRMKDGEEALYSAKELPVQGYLTRYENKHSDVVDRALNGGKVINYRLPVTGDKENLDFWWVLGATSSMILIAGIVTLMKNKSKNRGCE